MAEKQEFYSFQYFSKFFELTSNATIMKSHKYPIIGKQVAVIRFIQQVTITTIQPVLMNFEVFGNVVNPTALSC